MGRPSKYTEERADKIIQAIRVGATQRLAAAYAGIDEATLIRWRQNKADFAARLIEAEGAAAVGWNAIIEKAAPKDWRAAAWKLERRFPHDYGKTIQEQQHSGGLSVRVIYDDDSDTIQD